MRPPLRLRPTALAALAALLPGLTSATSALATTTTASAATTASAVHHATGVITYLDGTEVTIQTAGRMTGMINALTLAANDVTRRNYPYVWGGGHARAGLADAGATSRRGRHRSGYDCSGAVAAVLAGAGLWPAGSGVPNDAGVIRRLLSDGVIARGPSRGATGVTLYDRPGVHIFMNINGRFFGTSDGGGGANRAGGAGWLNDGAPDAFNRRFRQYHLVPSVLRDRTTYGHAITFEDATGEDLLAGFAAGDRVDVTYGSGGSGVLAAETVSWTGAVTATGTVASIAADGTSFVLQTDAGGQLTLSAAKLAAGLDGLQVGDTVQAVYTHGGAAEGLVARRLTVTATPDPTVTGLPTTGTGTPGDGSGYPGGDPVFAGGGGR